MVEGGGAGPVAGCPCHLLCPARAHCSADIVNGYAVLTERMEAEVPIQVSDSDSIPQGQSPCLERMHRVNPR